MRYLLTLLLTFSCFFSEAQSNNLLPERHAYKLSLPVEKGSVYEMEVPASPYVQNRTIVQIYPGETLYFEAEEEDGKIQLTSVQKVEHPEKTIMISCRQNVQDGHNEGTMLKISNPFKRSILYSARIFPMNANKWVKTNVLPVGARLSSIETWPDVILTLGFAGWRFASE